ncbi:MAG: head GIN domain-containing protein [Candidatus Cryptobacteroides sp.]
MKTIRMAGFVASLAAISIIASSCVVTVNKKAVRSFAKEKFVEASGVIVTRDTVVSPFTKLSVSGPIDVTFTQSTAQPSVKITTSDNIQKYVEVKIEGNTLKVGLEDGPARISDEIKVEIVGPAVDALKLAGSVDFTCAALGVEAVDFEMEVSGSTDAHITSIAAAEFGLASAGSCDLKLGDINVEIFKCALAGSGEISSDNVNADEVKVSIAGSGDMDMYVSAKELSASIAGSGELSVQGSVSRQAKYSIAGSGHINAKDLKCPVTSYETKGGSITYQDADGRIVKED